METPALSQNPIRHSLDLVDRLIEGLTGRADGYDMQVLDVLAQLPAKDVAVLDAFAARLMAMRNRYLSAKRLARLWRLRTAEIHELIARGTLKGIQWGGKWYIAEHEADRYIRTHTSHACAPDRSPEGNDDAGD